MKRYVLHPACRVRREKFGLLFYDRRGPKLLFAATGDLLEPEFFDAGLPSQDARAGSRAERSRVERLLTLLLDKGFLREQSVC